MYMRPIRPAIKVIILTLRHTTMSSLRHIFDIYENIWESRWIKKSMKFLKT